LSNRLEGSGVGGYAWTSLSRIGRSVSACAPIARAAQVEHARALAAQVALSRLPSERSDRTRDDGTSTAMYAAGPIGRPSDMPAFLNHRNPSMTRFPDAPALF
jgi:hypothetical protein